MAKAELTVFRFPQNRSQNTRYIDLAHSKILSCIDFSSFSKCLALRGLFSAIRLFFSVAPSSNPHFHRKAIATEQNYTEKKVAIKWTCKTTQSKKEVTIKWTCTQRNITNDTDTHAKYAFSARPIGKQQV